MKKLDTYRCRLCGRLEYYEAGAVLCIVNTKLRDFYNSLDHLIDDLGYNKDELIEILSSIGYYYDEKLNRFIKTNS